MTLPAGRYWLGRQGACFGCPPRFDRWHRFPAHPLGAGSGSEQGHNLLPGIENADNAAGAFNQTVKGLVSEQDPAQADGQRKRRRGTDE